MLKEKGEWDHNVKFTAILGGLIRQGGSEYCLPAWCLAWADLQTRAQSWPGSKRNGLRSGGPGAKPLTPQPHTFSCTDTHTHFPSLHFYLFLFFPSPAPTFSSSLFPLFHPSLASPSPFSFVISAWNFIYLNLFDLCSPFLSPSIPPFLPSSTFCMMSLLLPQPTVWSSSAGRSTHFIFYAILLP